MSSYQNTHIKTTPGDISSQSSQATLIDIAHTRVSNTHTNFGTTDQVVGSFKDMPITTRTVDSSNIQASYTVTSQQHAINENQTNSYRNFISASKTSTEASKQGSHRTMTHVINGRISNKYNLGDTSSSIESTISKANVNTQMSYYNVKSTTEKVSATPVQSSSSFNRETITQSTFVDIISPTLIVKDRNMESSNGISKVMCVFTISSDVFYTTQNMLSTKNIFGIHIFCCTPVINFTSIST
jgi:hypothetical protein